MEFLHKSPKDIQADQEEILAKETSPVLPPSSSSSSTSEHREPMFEKVVTPSDVGKLNRLVIPKQHAERYFPLDPSSNERGGLLLSFEEDRTGSPWRFRYSYWNSSQSYVMTKGWSRFVKDKHLNAGDTVLFSRGSEGRLFIDWKRRPVLPDPVTMVRSVVPSWGWRSVFPPPLYFGSTVSQIAVDHGILESVPVVARGSSIEPRRPVRLFGVDLESSEREEPPLPLQWMLSAMPPLPTRNHELLLMPSSGMEGAKKN